ncbi:CWF19-like protein 2 [Oryzias latipes]|uniref:CWF19-like protein 2 n=1 Tax=Oryzias latipes TaxID=8090 RepID=H2M3Y3_ORYLA|nr:CWF19-like protein 2 [Oryzias latipes]
MAAYGVSFESSSNIEEAKEKKRQARQEAIQKAKQQYEKEERRKELKRQRGEDTWILPEVNQRLEQLGDDGSLKSKKKKKEKKSKKKKEKKKDKKEKRKTEAGDASSVDSEDSAEEWVEAQPPKQPAKAWQTSGEAKSSDNSGTTEHTVQRDEWMTFDFLAMKTVSTSERRAEKERQKEVERAKTRAVEQASLEKLELNPFWKDGGSGLPPEEIAGTANKKAPVVNDGGLSWLKNSYRRMKEQAEREQRSLDSVVSERYGSVEEFQRRLTEAEEAVFGQRRDGRSERNGRTTGEEEDRKRWRRHEDTKERRSDRDSSPRRRGKYPEGAGEKRERHRAREEERSRDGDAFRERDRNEDEEMDGRRDRVRDNGGDRGSDRYRVEKREKQRPDGRSWNKHGVSLKGRFLKPSEDDDDCAAAPQRPKQAEFLKPSSDDEEDSGSRKSGDPALRKDGSLGRDPASQKRAGQETQKEAGKTVFAPQTSEPSRTEEESEEEDEENDETPLLSEEEMNRLGSKLIKAEMMGNTAMIEKLKSQLEAARKAKENHTARKKQQETAASNRATVGSSEDQEVLLYRTDSSGRAWPVKGPSGPVEPHGGRRKKKAIETHVGGERVRYFQDDDRLDLQEMVRREKMSSAMDQNALYSRMASKMMGKTDGDNYTLDDMFVSSAAQREGEGREEERMKNKAVGESRRLAASMEKCQFCFSSQELQKHLIVAIGCKVYLSLPAGVSMTEGHCLICPLQHHSCGTALDEDVWSEMQMFRKTLVRMFEDQDLDCVFMETHMNPRRKLHMVLECIPLPRELGDMAPIYFKKAIMECDEEWAMNKKIVDLSSRDIRQAVPRGLPYFAVDFGLQGGFAHVIENEQKFPHYFGKEIVGGMMDLEPRRWRKSIRENFDDQRKKVLQFAAWWKPFDCTKTEG